MNRIVEDKIRLWDCFCMHTMKPFFEWKRHEENQNPFPRQQQSTKSRMKNWLHERLIKKKKKHFMRLKFG